MSCLVYVYYIQTSYRIIDQESQESHVLISDASIWIKECWII